MNQYLLVKIRQLCVGNRLAKAGPMSGARPISEAGALAVAIAFCLTCNWRLDWVQFPYAAE